MKNETIIIIGMAGVGKSTVGKLLAEALNFHFTDLDLLINKNTNKSPQQIIDDEGEDALLLIEKQTMNSVDLHHRVVAPGGSIIYHPNLMSRLKQKSTLIYLQDSYKNIKQREARRNRGGVIGMRFKSFKELFNERKPLYLKYADIIINVSNKKPKEIIEKIRQLI